MQTQDHKMSLALFWLPLIAGLLLGGLAVGAWYGGDKALAVWVGFIGIVFLVLTGALQLQQYVWRVANQPRLVLLPSDHRSILRWDPPQSYQMQINDHPTPKYGEWKVPALLIRNTGVIAQDATIKWGVAPYEVQALIDSATRFKAYKLVLEENKIRLGPQAGGSGTPFIHALTWTTTVAAPFIARETQTFIPLNVWEHASLFFIATLPDQPNAKSEPFYFDVQIKWNIPEEGQPQNFRMKVVAVNAKPAGVATPEFLANIEIEITEIK